MIDSTNFLLEKHFKRLLWDKNVDILDPATGTGTFICNIIDKCPPQYLAHKYKHELHANDVAILPYYISNLNIEYTFKQKMNYYEEFKNLCFAVKPNSAFIKFELLPICSGTSPISTKSNAIIVLVNGNPVDSKTLHIIKSDCDKMLECIRLTCNGVNIERQVLRP